MGENLIRFWSYRLGMGVVMFIGLGPLGMKTLAAAAFALPIGRAWGGVTAAFLRSKMPPIFSWPPSAQRGPRTHSLKIRQKNSEPCLTTRDLASPPMRSRSRAGNLGQQTFEAQGIDRQLDLDIETRGLVDETRKDVAVETLRPLRMSDMLRPCINPNHQVKDVAEGPQPRVFLAAARLA